MTAVRAGDLDAFTELYGHFQPALGRFLRFHCPGRARSVGDAVWRGALVQLANFSGTEKDFRLLLYTVARRHLAELGLPEHPARPEHWVLPTASVDRAVALLGHSLSAEQGQVVVLRVVGDLDVDDTAHVLRTTSGAIRLTQYRALVMLVYQLGSRTQQPPSEEMLASFMDVSDPVPNLVFQGALPPWQARGALAPVARLVATARRRASDEERTISAELRASVVAMAGLVDAPKLERRALWTWTPGDRRARPRGQHITDSVRSRF